MKEKLIEFIDELMNIFDQKIIMNRLIYLHHIVRNVMEEEDLKWNAITFLTDEVLFQIANRDLSFLQDTKFAVDAELLWEACSPRNKYIIWKWIDVLVNLV